MRQYFTLLIVLVFLFLSFSCKEDFSPKSTFKPMYVLNCYVDVDYEQYTKTKVYATISKLYDVNGFNPSANNIDPTVINAEIYFTYRDILYKLHQDTNKSVITKYGSYQIYYDTVLQRIYPNYNVSVSAKMPDGTVLTGDTQLLEAVQLRYSHTFKKYFTTRINRFLSGEAFTITWGNIDNRLFIPELVIPCYKTDNSGRIQRYYKEVPYTYVKSDGHYQPVYPTYTTGGSASFDYSAIDSAMSELTKEDIDKSSVGSIMFRLIEMDPNLAKYYESTHGSLDPYSIKLDESTFSNIKGGLGIFGSKRTVSAEWYFDSTYAREFGFSL